MTKKPLEVKPAEELTALSKAKKENYFKRLDNMPEGLAEAFGVSKEFLIKTAEETLGRPEEK